MQVKAWNNGKHRSSGAGYGLKVSVSDRDRYFDRRWGSVSLKLPNRVEIEVNTNKKSFWDTTCRELIHKEIGAWLRGSGSAPWPHGHPPQFEMIPCGKRKFLLK